MSNKHYKWRECISAFTSMFSFVGFKIIDLEESKEILTVTLDATELPRCPKCGELCHRYDDVYIRSVIDFPVSIFSCRIQFPIRQIRCKCGYRGNQYIDFVNPYSHCTKRFEAYIATLCSKITISSVSQVTGLDWKTIKANRLLAREGTGPSLKPTPLTIGHRRGARPLRFPGILCTSRQINSKLG